MRVGKKDGFVSGKVAVRHTGVVVLTGNEKHLLRIYLKTGGHCHFCGDELEFEKRGWDADLSGRWEVDHVIQRKKLGASTAAKNPSPVARLIFLDPRCRQCARN